jgi:hypothetical protein
VGKNICKVSVLAWIALLMTVYSNPPDSLPIAEYCVVYERREFCDCISDTYDTTDVYLRFEKELQEQPDITICATTNILWTDKFLIHEDLKAEKNGGRIILAGSGFFGGFDNQTYYYKSIQWDFAYEVPIYAKNGKSFDLNKYNKYYERGKIIPVEWNLYAKCKPSETVYDKIYSGSYFIRITGECI